MAVYDGFFDARYDEDTGTYDRAYGVEDFTTYFGQIVGSGVCVYQNKDSYKVRLEDGNAIISPGYLFISGHWQKNDADYTVELSGTGPQAIVASLNANEKRIDLEARSVAQSYPDALVLAFVNAESGTVEDMRYNTDICGVIDAAGNVSSQIAYCLQYIDTQIQTKLDQIEADIIAQAADLDKAISNVSAEVNKIIPPSIGSIKCSLAPDVGGEWLKCDGSYITEEEYPELVSLLRETGLSAEINEIPVAGLYNGGLASLGVHSGALWFGYPTNNQLIGIKPNGEILNIFVSPYAVSSMVDVPGGVRLIYARFSGVTTESDEDVGSPRKRHLVNISVRFGYTEVFDPLNTTSISMSLRDIDFDPSSYLGEYIYPIRDSDSAFYTSPTSASFYSAVSIGGKFWGRLAYFMACPEGSYTNDTTGGLVSRKGRSYLILFVLDADGAFDLKFLTLNDYSYFRTDKLTNAKFQAELNKYMWSSDPTKTSNRFLYFSQKDYVFEVCSFDGSNEEILSVNNTFPAKLGATGGDILGVRENQVLVYFSASSSGVTTRIVDLDTGLLAETVMPCSIPTVSFFSNLLSPYLKDQDIWLCFTPEKLLFLRNLSSSEQYSTQSIKNLWDGKEFDNYEYLEYDGVDTLYFGFKTTTYKILCFSIKIPTPFEPFTGANLPSISFNGLPTYIKAKKEEADAQ